MRICKIVKLGCALLVILGLALSSYAQTETATLSGRITDQSGAVVPGVQVEITNVDTNISVTTTTNDAGLYAFANLRPGTYRLIVRKTGFTEIIKPDVVLHVQDAVLHNFTLVVGSIAQSITVRGETGGMSTSPAVSTVIDRQFVENLPLNGRSFNTLLQLTPGVVIVPSKFSMPGQFSISGQRTNANYFTVDGVSVNFGVMANPNTWHSGGGGAQAFNAYGGTSSLVAVDAVEEFRIQTSTFAPEYGRTPGGQVSISTRSGTNSFHGGLFDYFRNDKLDANDWFANAAGIPKAANRQNDFGGFLGGPIVPDKTFFFFSYEGLRLRLPQTRVVTVPSLAVRAAAVPAAAPYFNAFPQPNGPDLTSTTAQFTGSFSDPTTLNATSVRIDHMLSNKVTIFGRYNHAPSSVQDRLYALNTVGNSEVNTKTLTVGTTLQFTPRVSNSFRANYSVQEGKKFLHMVSLGGATVADPSLLLPAPLSAEDSSVSFYPFEMNLGGGLNFGQSADNRTNQINLVNNLALTAGAHQLKFGVDYVELLLDKAEKRAELYYFIFSLQNLAANGTADMVYNFHFDPAKVLSRSLSLYGQDAWNVGQRLTLTYGLRWEFNPAPSGRDGTILTSWTTVDDLPNIALAPPGTPLWKNTYDNFAPRLGVAYRVTSKGDLVVRGGWGVFYDLGRGSVGIMTSAFPNQSYMLAFGLTLPLTDLTPVTPLPVSLQPPYPPSYVRGFSPELKLPRSQQWNLAVEKSLGGEQAISVTYVGQMGRRLLRQEALVQPNPDFPGYLMVTGNGDTSDYHALQVQFRRRMSRGLQALLNYTWSHSIDTNSNDVVYIPSNTVISVGSNRGSSSFDVRHNFSAAFTYELPSATNQGPLAQLTKGWSIDTVVQARTGFPFDVSNRVPIPGLMGATRVDRVPGEPFWLQDESAGGGKSLNPAAFALPPTLRQGTLGRNAIRGFGMTQVDLSLGRRFGLTEKLNLQFRADMFNLFNHPNFDDNLRNPSLSAQGVLFDDRSTEMLNRGLGGLNSLYQAGGPRSMQLSLKLTF